MNMNRIKQVGWLLVFAGVLCSLFLWGQRMQSEADYKSVQMAVNYSDVVAMANANDLTEEEFAKIAKPWRFSSAVQGVEFRKFKCERSNRD